MSKRNEQPTIEDFERTWRTLLRKNKQAADRYRRAWNRYVYSKVLQKRLPPLYVQTVFEEVTRLLHNRAVAKRRVLAQT